MKIHNDFRCLDKEVQYVNSQLEQLTTLKDRFSKEIDKLFMDGFKDAKFLELKTAVEKSGQEILKLKKSIDKCVIEMQKRSEIIKQYYSVNI
jgi:hypothetical protein